MRQPADPTVRGLRTVGRLTYGGYGCEPAGGAGGGGGAAP